MTTSTSFWILFNIFILSMLAIDLGVFNKKAHSISFKESLLWSVIWICLAMIFNILIYYWKGSGKAFEFLTGYLIELSLSVDNLFVFILIFGYFQTPSQYQHRVLFWGIIGALILRAIFIFAGVALIEKFHWITFVFGAIIIFSGYKMLFQKDKKIEPEKNPVVRMFKRFFPVTGEYHGSSFFIKQGTMWVATPLAIVLVLIETTDLIFAVDSIPAILAITTDPFIVYTSNVFAILGLRSLYFALSGIISIFRFINYGLAAILIFIGLKMILAGADVYTLPTEYALITVLVILITSIVASLAIKPLKQ